MDDISESRARSSGLGLSGGSASRCVLGMTVEEDPMRRCEVYVVFCLPWTDDARGSNGGLPSLDAARRGTTWALHCRREARRFFYLTLAPGKFLALSSTPFTLRISALILSISSSLALPLLLSAAAFPPSAPYDGQRSYDGPRYDI